MNGKVNELDKKKHDTLDLSYRKTNNNNNNNNNDDDNKGLTINTNNATKEALSTLKLNGSTTSSPATEAAAAIPSSSATTSSSSSSSSINITQDDIHRVKMELEKNLQEERMLLQLQMQLTVQLEELKKAVSSAEREERVATLALQQAKIERLLKSGGIHEDEEESITIQVVKS